jgi:hypothetical protein
MQKIFAKAKNKKPLKLIRGFSENLNVRSFFGRKLTQVSFSGYGVVSLILDNSKVYERLIVAKRGNT